MTKTRRLRCPNCDDWRILDFRDKDVVYDGITVHLRDAPFLHCPSCEFDEDVSAVQTYVHAAAADAEKCGEVDVHVNVRVTGVPSGYCKSVSFNCDNRDYRYIPGLYRGGTWGTLTPVFFKPEVLQKYGFNEDYQLDMPSGSGGTIHMPNHDLISFGVNRRGEAFVWAGDLCNLDEPEQSYLKSFNIPSSHDVGSDFYDSQIEVEYTKLSGVAKLFDVRARFNRAVCDKFGFGPTQLDDESNALISAFTPPIDRAKKGIERAVHDLDKVCVETINRSAFLNHLISRGGADPGGGSLKTLEAWIAVVLGRSDAADIACPFFVLNDLRQLEGHLIGKESSKEKLESACARIGISTSSPVDEVFDVLVENLIDSYQSMTSVIDDAD